MNNEYDDDDDDNDDDGDHTENSALREARNGSHSSRRTGRISTTQNEVREKLMFQT